jgi:hypothetical protein
VVGKEELIEGAVVGEEESKGRRTRPKGGRRQRVTIEKIEAVAGEELEKLVAFPEGREAKLLEKFIGRMRDSAFLDLAGRNLDARMGNVKVSWNRKREDGMMISPTLRDVLIGTNLLVRSKEKGLVPLILNKAQEEYSKRCSRRNIVLKARQLGMTTYIAARFFIQTITQPGTLTVQVAHNRESAEEISRIVHRFWEHMPVKAQRHMLVTSHCNLRQMVFPRIDSEYRVEAADENAGRGLTTHNLHCSEVSRWSRGGQEALASLRAAVPAGGDVVIEGKFKDGLGKIIDGTVECLNASTWAKVTK